LLRSPKTADSFFIPDPISRLNGAARRKPDRARCRTNFVAKLAQHCASHFELFGLSLRQLLRNCLQTVVGAGPEEDGVFKGTGTEDQRQQPHDPVRLKTKVRIQPVIAKCDRKSACEEHHREEPDLEPIDPEEPDISGHRSEREK
jgi:hypothetical protein